MARGGLERPPLWAVTVMVVALAALVGGLVYAHAHPARDPMTPAQAAQESAASVAADASEEAARQRIVAVLGDSWTEGTGATRPDGGFAYQVAAAEKWQLINDGQGGTGYVTAHVPGYPTRTALPARVADVIRQKPDVVIVAAGDNDANRSYPDAAVRAAVDATLGGLKKGLPTAVILVIGPWSPGAPTLSMQNIDSIVGAEARKYGLPFVSPVADQWITDSQYIGPDGAHPSQAGHDYIAKRVEQWLATIPRLPVTARR